MEGSIHVLGDKWGVAYRGKVFEVLLKAVHGVR